MACWLPNHLKIQDTLNLLLGIKNRYFFRKLSFFKKLKKLISYQKYFQKASKKCAYTFKLFCLQIFCNLSQLLHNVPFNLHHSLNKKKVLRSEWKELEHHDYCKETLFSNIAHIKQQKKNPAQNESPFEKAKQLKEEKKYSSRFCCSLFSAAFIS